MNARDVIRRALLTCIRRGTVNPWPEVIISELSAAGFTIMSKEDVEAVRNELLDRASEAALTILINDTDSNPRMAAKVENAIRSLKSIPHKE